MTANDTAAEEMKDILSLMAKTSKLMKDELMGKHESFLVRLPKDLKKLKIPISDEIIEVLGAQPNDIVRVTIELEKPKQPTMPEPKTAYQLFATVNTPVISTIPSPSPFTVVSPFSGPTDDSKTATTHKTDQSEV